MFTEKSIWLIRHGEKDETMTTYFMDTFKELNYEWPLSDRGLVQSHKVATVLKNQYFEKIISVLIYGENKFIFTVLPKMRYHSVCIFLKHKKFTKKKIILPILTKFLADFGLQKLSFEIFGIFCFFNHD